MPFQHHTRISEHLYKPREGDGMNHLLILFHLFHVRRKKNLNLLLCQVQVAGTKRTVDAPLAESKPWTGNQLVLAFKESK